MIKRLWNTLEQKLRRISIFNEGFTFAGEMGRRSLPTNAAGISFYFFLSAVPFSILLCSQLPYTGITREDMIEAITRFTPDSVAALVENVITQAYTSRIALFSVSLLALMWSSAKVVTALIRSLDAVYGTPDRRNYFIITGRSLLYTAVLLLGSGGLLLLTTRGKTAEAFLLSLFPVSGLTPSVSAFGRRLIGGALFTVVFSLVYTVFPAGKRRFLCQLPGALLAQLGVTVFTAFYTIYSTRGNVYTSFYGSLANLAVFMMWIYFCVILFLLGATFNAQYQDRILRFFKRIKQKLRKNRKNTPAADAPNGDAPGIDVPDVLTLEMEAKTDHLDRLHTVADAFLQANHCPAKTIRKLDLCMEEVFVSVAGSADPGGAGTVQIRLSAEAGVVTLTFSDAGKPYDPLRKADPEIALNAEDGELGNLGILIVKKIMDSVSYRYENGRNVLTMTKSMRG